MITTQNNNYKCISSFLPVSNKSTKKILQAAANVSDTLSGLVNKQIERNIESFVRTFSKKELEFLKYLYYFFKKWDGNIQIPILNLCNRFGLRERWVHNILARLYKAGLVYTLKGGYGRKVTCRSFSERALIIIKNLIPTEKISKQLMNRKNADYCADYSADQSNYISTKGDILQESTVSQSQEGETKTVFEHLGAIKSMLGVKMNE